MAVNVFQPGLYDLDSVAGILRLVVATLALTAVVHVAARMVLDKSDLYQALACAVLGILASQFLGAVVESRWAALAVVASLVCFAAIIGLIYRTKRWTKGAAVGGVAWAIWWLVSVTWGAVAGAVG